MASLSALDVSLGSALPSGSLKRLLFRSKKGKESQPAQIQPLKGAMPVFLWAGYSDGVGEEVVLEVRILEGHEALPEVQPGHPGSWVRIKRDLSAGKVKPLRYLAYRRGQPSEREPPIVAVAVLRPQDKLGECSAPGGGMPCPWQGAGGMLHQLPTHPRPPYPRRLAHPSPPPSPPPLPHTTPPQSLATLPWPRPCAWMACWGLCAWPWPMAQLPAQRPGQRQRPGLTLWLWATLWTCLGRMTSAGSWAL